MIHKTAIIHESAKIDASVEVGPYAVIGADVELGADCVVDSHVVIQGPTTIGSNNHFYSFASIGNEPQDKKFHGEKTYLEIGADNIFREYCTVNRGTGSGGGVTRVGSGNWILAYAHIAHDCMIGNHTVFSNNASLAGHVTVGDHAILSGFVIIHQFCSIGEHSFSAMGSVINKDVPPYILVSGHIAQPYGLNSEGLKRRGFSEETISKLKKAYKVLYKSKNGFSQAKAEISRIATSCDELKIFSDFLNASKRGIVR